ncbi:beta-lactamase/transpeptidase-like protein [Cercophora newfieldiana]|uniref:Beta-lactamase/transpeptidase-like protein n=1 Tax=Cercophora newfieldiana TaxID=92897 RepID=A0AA39XV49_9PEZI|nr:beta-lactamase/transpeptidase-like protein [Cercophora newfieldiana]
MVILGGFPRSVGELLARFLSAATFSFSRTHCEDGHTNSTPRQPTSEKYSGLDVSSAMYKSQNASSEFDRQQDEKHNRSNRAHRLFQRRRMLRRSSAKPMTMELSAAKPSQDSIVKTVLPASIPSNNAHMRATIDVASHLCSKYGTVGLSAGLLDSGEISCFNIGTLELPGNASRPTSQDSIYLVSSLTKPIFALAIAIMVNDNQYNIDFTTEVRDMFPELAGKTFLRHAGRELTLVDLLDNRTEFPKCTNLWESPNGIVPWGDTSPLLSVLRHLPPNEKFQTPASFEHARNYSNEGFALAAAILEKKSGMPWAKFVRQRILKPLQMENTIAGQTSSDTKRYANRLARSFSASIDEHVKELRSWRSKGVDHQRAFRYLRDTVHSVTPIEVAPSQASRAANNLKSTPMGAAAGIMSSVSDLLKFYAKFIEVYHLPEDRKSFDGSSDLSEVERGMLTVQKHIRDMAVDNTCAYAAGWSTAVVPWGSDSVPRPRWPGEDGDNARWLNKTAAGNWPASDNMAPPEWPFFQRRHAEEQQRLVLNHGGNMIGATSFCLVDLERKRAVVVLTNTRGYMVDCANFVGMLMATQGDAEFIQNCNKVKDLACLVATNYLQEVCKYEEDLNECYPSWPVPASFHGCVGTYKLADGIFVTISQRESDGRLIFQLYGDGYEYPLRLSRDMGTSVKMTIATSMTELLPTGVGGNNRLELKGFEIEFQGKDPVSREFSEFVWDFSMTGRTATDASIPELYTFKRVTDGL